MSTFPHIQDLNSHGRHTQVSADDTVCNSETNDTPEAEEVQRMYSEAEGEQGRLLTAIKHPVLSLRVNSANCTVISVIIYIHYNGSTSLSGNAVYTQCKLSNKLTERYTRHCCAVRLIFLHSRLLIHCVALTVDASACHTGVWLQVYQQRAVTHLYSNLALTLECPGRAYYLE